VVQPEPIFLVHDLGRGGALLHLLGFLPRQRPADHATRGIGKATAVALAERGVDVAVNYQTSESAAEKVCELIRAKGRRAHAFQANIAEEAEVRQMLEEIGESLGKISILINNAGITRDKSFLKITRMMWDGVLGVNLNGPFLATPAVLPDMISAGWGRIMNCQQRQPAVPSAAIRAHPRLNRCGSKPRQLDHGSNG
jgi:NAD(P)-dependent dehydrogenase (short-subunit alcohol dehydrogenase family)